jgi:hypothetical protein
MRESSRIVRQNIPQHRFIDSKIGYHLLQPSIFLLEFFELANLFNPEPNVLLLPLIGGLLGNSHASDQLTDRDSPFRPVYIG